MSLHDAAQIRAQMGHPVVDSDAHIVEFTPGLFDYMDREMGPAEFRRVKRLVRDEFGTFPPQVRWDRRIARQAWWLTPAKNTRDLATAMLPKLLYERMNEVGLDFSVLYPSLTIVWPHLPDRDLRASACRAANRYSAQLYAEFKDRMTPAALIPMHTPQEAIEELEYAVRTLGTKSILMAGWVKRPIPEVAKRAPEATPWAFWLDFFGLESEYDYDPVWAKCVELGVAPSFHSGGMGIGTRMSVNNYMFNHLGHFASAMEGLCKAMFLGGVTRRFPKLRFAFLECGVAWATTLYADLIGHWDKRNGEAIHNYNPKLVDVELFAELCRCYGGALMEQKQDLFQHPENLVPIRDNSTDLDTLDDFARCGIKTPEDIRDLFIPHFFFGCEADDPANATAFDTKRNPFGARLNAIFSSDIGHWDVPDMREVLHEAYELVEKGLITEDDLRQFTFVNPVRYLTAMNRNYFKDTVIEGEVNRLLAEVE
jgi:predicted TIM-barrel fold metal-dependent hydrolase